ncbi:c-type cytochrome [Paraburkholderia diazotrophica]|uniref:c-type cytochrome n=1 Tax=Paraburkholderia diazotrophica TaxID=667676 RepID=UPI0031717833
MTPAHGFGRSPTVEEVAGWNIDVVPDGTGLPIGHGTAAEGATVFAARCAACHGAKGEGVPVSGRGAFPRLVGGIGTLVDDVPIKTVGSYWPYATGVFDYIRRAMPLTAPGSLTSNEAYSLTAFILARNGIISENAVMDEKSLPGVSMPNRNGFFRSAQSQSLARPRSDRN